MNKLDTPLVSVIMPAYNAEKYIAKAIDSILGQTYKNFELIIIDDCSLDKTMNIVDEYKDSRILIFHNSCNKGISYSRNLAIAKSRGKYVAIMDDDDISFEHRFAQQVNFLEQNSNIDIVGGKVQNIDENDNIISEQTDILKNPYYIKVNFLFKCIFHNSEVMFRKKIIEEFGIHYRENCYGMEDFRFWIECSKVAKMANLDSFMLKHRYFEGSETSRIKREHYAERMLYYDELQRLSFRLSGFELSENEFRIINSCFRGGIVATVNQEILFQLFRVMKKVVQQAEEKKMDFTKELDIYLKKTLASLIRTCPDLWRDKSDEKGSR